MRARLGMMSGARRLIFVALMLLALPEIFGATVTARLDRDNIMVGDTATLEVRVENGSTQSPPVFATQANLSVQFVGQGSQYAIVNGRTSTALILNYAVTATQPGTYTISATQVVVDGAALSTQPLRLVVSKDEASAAPGSGPAFIRLQVAKTNVYVGELIPIDIRVYGLVIDELQVPTLKSDGFTIGTQAPGARGRETVGNNIYNVYSFQMTVAPAKAGTLNLGPAQAAMIIRVAAQGRRRMDLFEEMLGGVQRKQITAASEAVAINVMPLPTANRPASFNGALGKFQIAVTASPTNVSVGDPISLQIQVQGEGSFDTVKLPDFGWKDFTFYPPNSTVTNLDSLGTRATKTFDQVVVPQRAGIATIPPIVFSFFDPQAGTYRTVQRPAIPISVRATGHGQAQPTVVADQGISPQPQGPANDIVHIKASLGQMSWAGAPMATRPWFIALQLLPIALWGGAVAWRRRNEALANDPRLRRQREVSRYISENVPKLREFAAAKQSEQFFAATFRLLQEQIGERLDVPASAITEAAVDDGLPKLGASAELLTRLRELFQACNQARYAGATVAGMEALIPEIEKALQDVQKLPHSGGDK